MVHTISYTICTYDIVLTMYDIVYGMFRYCDTISYVRPTTSYADVSTYDIYRTSIICISHARYRAIWHTISFVRRTMSC